MNIESFTGNRMYVGMPKRNLIFLLDFKLESTVVYTDSIIMKLDNLAEIQESGLFKIGASMQDSKLES